MAFAWGFNKYGQLGNGETVNAELPQRVKLPKGWVPTDISCGAHFTLIAAKLKTKQGDERSAVFSCGWGKHGRLGTGTEDDQKVPKEVAFGFTLHLPQNSGEADKGGRVSGAIISAGHWHAACVTEDGQLLAWGYKKSLGGAGGAAKPVPEVPATANVVAPLRIPFPDGVSIKTVSCGFNYTYCVNSEGLCYSWGCGNHGVLGHGDLNDRLSPTLVDGLKEEVVRHVDCGFSHATLVSSNASGSGGKVFVTGSGETGALGLGSNRTNRLVPTVIPSLLDRGVCAVSASCSKGEHHAHTLVCSEDGRVFSFGDGYKGKLGHGDQESCDVPKPIEAEHFLGRRVVSVSCGGIHSLAVTEDGSLFTWGCGSDGRLGHPEAKGHRYLFRSDIPRRVELLSSSKVMQASCSYYHTAVVCREGSY